MLFYFVTLSPLFMYSFFFFFNDTATTEIYTLSLHDALPIYIGYSYRDKNKEHEPVRIYKRVHFYLLRYIRGDVRDHDHEEIGRPTAGTPATKQSRFRLSL